jgi:hypothetical protein
VTAIRRPRLRYTIPSLLFVLSLPLDGCGYYNTMYNARRHFAEAERLREKGEAEAAGREWAAAIDGAAASYRGHPRSRWADDALYLIGRARFHLGDRVAARTAFMGMLDISDDPILLEGARSGIGAIDVADGEPAAGLARLDSAIASAADRNVTVFALLWRARARFALGTVDSAWSDLDRVSVWPGGPDVDAVLESAAQAVVHGDTVRFRHAILRLYADARAASRSDSCLSLIRRAAFDAGPSYGRSITTSIEESAWTPDAMASHRLEQVRFTAASGDTAAAVQAALVIAAGRDPVAVEARRLAVTLELARAGRDDLDRIRDMLMPAVPGTGDIVQALAAIAWLLDRGHAGGQPLALFAAAELARDELHAGRLARQLFLDYAGIDPHDLWAPKALLAAVTLEDDPAAARDIIGRFSDAAPNVYVEAVLGRPDPDAFMAAEARLARTLNALREAARSAARGSRADSARVVDGSRSLRGEMGGPSSGEHR